MIKEYKRIDLFGKLLFEKALILPPFRAPNPMHNEACFLHVREGGYKSFSESEFLKINTKQSVLMKCGNYVGQMVSDKKTGQYQAVAVHFHPEVLRRIYGNDLPNFLVNKKKNTPRHNMALIEASIPVDKYVEDVLFYFDNPHLVNEELLCLKTKEIVLLLMQTQNAPHILQILENLFTERTVDFKTTIAAHIFSEISINELAQLTHMSLSTFKRKFKEIYQLPPQQYILGQRLAKAKDLLQVSDDSIQDIAFATGFKTIHHFSFKFKQHFGSSPSKYRLGFLGK
ncbi:helix-turn-helix transcriptional regulator [Flagellimonas flava]|uniref:helix-turn-helix transcriptional regulator n=1 Tax=Flagellimonas flava TaxID=570519 RepID=UPI003D65832A